MKLPMRCLQLVLAAVFAILIFGCGQGSIPAVPPAPSVPTVPPNQPTSPDTAPVLISISSPSSATAGGAAFFMVVTGSGFKSNSVVLWNGSPRVTQSAGQDALQAQITAADIAQAGIAKISVNNPTTGSAQALTSGTLDFPIFSLRLASLSPSFILEGSSGASIDVLGTGFVPGSVVRWNGETRPTTFTSATKLVVTLTASDLAFAGIVEVVVENPSAPYSNLQFFVVSSAGMSTERISLGDASEQLSTAAYAPTIDYDGAVVSYVLGNDFTGNTVMSRNTCLNAGSGCAVTNTVVATDSGGDVIDFVQTSNAPDISANGRWVAFSQYFGFDTGYLGSNLGLRDTCLGAQNCTPSTSIPSLYSTGHPINDVAAYPSLSADARYVAFTAGISDGYSFIAAQPVVYDSCRGVAGSCTPGHSLLEAFSETGEPVPFAYTNRQSLSADGRYLAFAGIIEANVYTGGPNDFGVWVRDSCRGADPSCVPSTVRASINVNGQPLTGDYYIGFAMSASGRYIAFTAYDGVGNVLLRDTCIGAPSGCVPVTTKLFSRGQSTPYGLSISADGQRVAFAMWHFDLYSQTLSSHVFALDTCAGVAVCAPRAFLVSSDPSGSVGNGLSVAPMISGDGKSVVFQSDASNLVPGDTNGVSDIFRTVLP